LSGDWNSIQDYSSRQRQQGIEAGSQSTSEDGKKNAHPMIDVGRDRVGDVLQLHVLPVRRGLGSRLDVAVSGQEAARW
jgi:hypothetical protein